MGICGSLMDIFDYPQARSANKYCFTKLNEIKNNPFLEKTIRLYRLLDLMNNVKCVRHVPLFIFPFIYFGGGNYRLYTYATLFAYYINVRSTTIVHKSTER